MKIVILGTGSVAKKFATIFANKGHSISICSRNIDSAKSKLSDILSDNICVVPPISAIREADAVFLAFGGNPTNSSDVKQILESYSIPETLMSGKVVLDATNPFSSTKPGCFSDYFVNNSLGETYQSFMPGSRFYKAFNTIGVLHLGNGTFQNTQATMMYAGDSSDADAINTVEALIRDADFKPQWVGPMRFARNLESIAELWVNMAYFTKATKESFNNFAISVLTK